MYTYFVDDDTTLNKENVDPMEADDWLHRNDSYQTQNIVDENMTTRLSCNYIWCTIFEAFENNITIT
jgi:hypothetical protein